MTPMPMDWYEALKAWQDGKLPAEEAIRICEVADTLELWELTLSSGIDIKLAGVTATTSPPSFAGADRCNAARRLISTMSSSRWISCSPECPRTI